MAYRKTDPEVIRLIKTLRAQGLSLDGILDRMEELRRRNGTDDPTASRGTVAKYMKEFSDLDRPFQWQRLEEDSLPWEAGGILLEIWAYAIQLKASLEAGLKRASTDTDIPTIPTDQLTATVRQARWWWRVHCAAPDLTANMKWKFGFECAMREQVYELLDEPFDLSDVQGYLAFGEWRQDAAEGEYARLVNEESLPPLTVIDVDVILRMAEAMSNESGDDRHILTVDPASDSVFRVTHLEKEEDSDER